MVLSAMGFSYSIYYLLQAPDNCYYIYVIMNLFNIEEKFLLK